MSIVKHQLSFGAGEWSPWLDGRSDLEKYNSACRLLRNNIALPQGGFQKRPGLEFIALAQAGATNGRLVEFQISTTEAAMLAIAGGKLAIYDADGQRVLDASDVPVLLDVPWTDAQLPLLRWRQINSVVYFTHPNVPQQKLTRYAADDWELAAVDYSKRPPLLRENIEELHTIAVSEEALTLTGWAVGVAYKAGRKVGYPSVGTVWKCMRNHTSQSGKPPGSSGATYNEVIQNGNTFQLVSRPLWVNAFAEISAVPGQEVTLTASLDTWEPGHVGAMWEVSRRRTATQFESELKLSGSAVQYSLPMVIQGGWEFITFGNWRGTWTIQRSDDYGITWQDVRAWQGDNDRNVTAEGDEDRRVQMRLKWVKDSDATGVGHSNGARGTLTSREAKIRGLLRITAFTDARSVKAEVITPVEIVKTYSWAESAWNDVQGYPRVVELHQGCIVFAATPLRPHSLWGSAADDYENFYIGSDATDAWTHTIAIGERDPILWLVSERFLLVGTGCGEWVMYGADEEKAITPEDGNARRHSSYGAHNGGVPACFSDSVSLFVQRGGTRVREFAYRFEADRYEAANLNLLADHLFSAPVDDIAVMRMPWQVVWFISDGELFGLTYERAQGVAAWHRHETQGDFVSVGSIRATGPEDQVWFLVDRGDGLLIERFKPGLLADPSDDSGWWMDSAVAVPPPYNVSTAEHLTGREVIGYVDRTAYGPATLAGTTWPFVTLQVLVLARQVEVDWQDLGGTFYIHGVRAGKYWWGRGGYDPALDYAQWVYDNGGRWVMYHDGEEIFESTEDVAYPHQVTTWFKVGSAFYQANPVWSASSINPALTSGMIIGGMSDPDVNETVVPYYGELDGFPAYVFNNAEYSIGVSRAGGDWTFDITLVGSGAIFSWVSLDDVASPDLVTTWVPLLGGPVGTPTLTPHARYNSLDAVLGFAYTSAMVPMTPEIPLANGSSRSREMRIHRIVPSLMGSRGGKIGETVDGVLDPLNAGSAEATFTGEIEKDFQGGFGEDGNVCLVSDEPYPFSVRTLALKMNVHGDG